MHDRHRASHAWPKRYASPHYLLGKSFSGQQSSFTIKVLHSTALLPQKTYIVKDSYRSTTAVKLRGDILRRQAQYRLLA